MLPRSMIEIETNISELSDTLTDLAACVELMLSDSMTALRQFNLPLAQEISQRDIQANNMQRQIDEDALRIMTLKNLPATQIRKVINSVKIANDLERVGDLAEGIARRIRFLTADSSPNLTSGIERMGKQVAQQLSHALDALSRDNSVTAVQVWIADEDIDELYNALFRELLTYMMEDPQNITHCTNLLFMAKNLERIGDHATNIAESVYFTLTGVPLIEDEMIIKFMDEQNRGTT